MKKVLLVLGGGVALLVVAAGVALAILDGEWLKGRIATAVEESTGRRMTIAGPATLSLFPDITVELSDLRLANAEGRPDADMLTVASVSAKVRLWPLIGRQVIIDRLVITEPVLLLEVDQAGRPNWAFPARPDETGSEAAEPAEGAPVSDLRLGDVRIVNGRVRYYDAVAQQTVEATEIGIGAALAGLASPLAVTGAMTLNGEPVTLELALDSLARFFERTPFGLELAVAAAPVSLAYEGSVQQQPVPGLSGGFELAVPSVARLAAWLDRPLAGGQPDPGPLAVTGRFTADGKTATIEELTVAGAELEARATGRYDATGEVAKLTLAVESPAFNLNRYLPPAAEPAPAARPSEPAAEPAARRASPVEALPTEPFNLAPLRRLEADIRVALANVRARDLAIDRLDFTTSLAGGVLVARIDQLSVNEGNVALDIRLDASGDALGLEASLDAERVGIQPFAPATGQGLTVAGRATTVIDIGGRGDNPRALVESLTGTALIDLGEAQISGPGIGRIAGAKAALAFPGIDAQPTLEASLTYEGEPVEIDLVLDPLRRVLSEDRFKLLATLASAPVNLKYDGFVQQKPGPGLDGALSLAVPSVGRLASWLGRPLPANQPDPGPLTVEASFVTDGAVARLQRAVLQGKALDATAEGSFDSGKPVPEFQARIAIVQADLNAYLPAPQAAPAAEPAAAAVPAAPVPAGAAAGGWSEEPIDLSALKAANGEAVIEIGRVLYRDLAIAEGRMTVALRDGVLTQTLENLRLAEGTIRSAATVSAAGPVPTVAYELAASGVQARPLLRTFAGNDRLSGTLEYATRGETAGLSQKDMVRGLNGEGSFKFLDGAIHGINLAATLRQVRSLGLSQEAGQEQKTDFSEMAGSFTIVNGTLRNEDFRMLAPLIRLAGRGVVDMPAQTLDYDIEAKLVPTLEGQGGQDALAGIPIPIHVEGPWSAPRYGVDWDSVLKSAATDPQRLMNLPNELKGMAPGLGIALPGLTQPGTTEDATGGTTGALPTTVNPLDALKGVLQPGLPTAPAPAEQPATEAPAAEEPAAEEPLADQPAATEPALQPGATGVDGGEPSAPAQPGLQDLLKSPESTLKGLFGN